MLEPTDEMIDALFDRASGGEFASTDDLRHGIAGILAIVEREISDGWLIWSRYHNAWWKADERGYTVDMMCAGRYDREHADRLAAVRKMDDGTPGEVVVRAPEVGLIGAPNLMEKMRGRISAATRAAKAAV